MGVPNSKLNSPKVKFPNLLAKCSMGSVLNGEKSLPEKDLVKIMEYTNEEKQKIQDNYRQFLTQHPKGKISKKAFQSMLSDCWPGADASLLAGHIWRVYDLNEDGKIDFTEFMTVLHVMSCGTSEENLRQIFRVFDINGDGKISPAELEQIVVDLQLGPGSLVTSVFSEMDGNQDGEITPEEFVEACLAQKKTSTMLTLRIIEIFT